MFLLFVWLTRFILRLVSMPVRVGIALADRLKNGVVSHGLSVVLGAVDAVRVFLMLFSWILLLVYLILLLVSFILIVVSAITAIGVLDYQVEESVSEVSMAIVRGGMFL